MQSAVAAPALPAAVTVRRHARWWNEETRFAWASLLPALLFFGLFVGFPFGYSFYHSWCKCRLSRKVNNRKLAQ